MRGGSMQHTCAIAFIVTLLLAPIAQAAAEAGGVDSAPYPIFLAVHWNLHPRPSGVSDGVWRAELMALADKGDPEAQYLVGRIQEAAEGGYVYALERLGLDQFRAGKYDAAFPLLL